MKLIEKIVIVICVIGFILGIGIVFCYYHKTIDGTYQLGNKYYIEDDNDLVIVESIDFSKYEKDDYVAYYTSDNKGSMIIEIGKIKRKNKDNDYIIEKNNKELEIRPEDIIGKYNNKKISKGVNISNLLINRIGFVVVSVIPLIILLLIEFILLLKEYLNRNNSYNT